MNYYDIYIIIIFILKITIIILGLTHFGFVISDDYFNIDSNIVFWKSRLNFLFEVLTAFLLFYIFNPFYDNTDMIDNKTKFLFYLLAVSLIISSNYNTFFRESILYTYYLKKSKKEIEKEIKKNQEQNQEQI